MVKFALNMHYLAASVLIIILFVMHVSHGFIQEVGKNTAIHTAKKIAKNDKGITKIFVSHTKINDEGVLLIAEALKKNEYLTHLDLRENLITDVGAIALANALEINHSLQWLDLNANDIGDEGCKAFLKTIKNNRNLTALDLHNNVKIHDDYLFAVNYCLIHEDECNDLHTWSDEKLKDMAITFHRHTGEANHVDDVEEDGSRHPSDTSVWPERQDDDVERDPHLHYEM